MSAPDPNRLGETLKRAADAATPRPIDVDAVLRASGARRRARRTAVVGGVGAAAAVLVIGGGVMAGLQGLGGPTAAEAPTAFESAEVSPDTAEERGDAGATDQRFVAPEQVNRCGTPVAAPTDAATSPLTVTVEVTATLVQPGTANPATVRVTNTGTDVVSGSLGGFAPITVAASGITVWHSGPGELPSRQISLAPGESTVLEGAFETRSCTAADDLGSSLPDDLPGLEPGEYGVSAIVSFTSPDGAITYLVSPLARLAVG